MGAEETVRDLSTRLFVASARRLLPELEVADVRPGPSGIRAQALAPDGTLLDDFVFHEGAGVVHVRNAPSPGATSSLAIAAVVADRVEATIGRA
jgi:L-2-hydroxyglutarate oxidase LhgO